MRRQLYIALIVTLLTLSLAACGPATLVGPTEVTVSAAASLGSALAEAQTAFEAEHGSVKIRLNLGSSGALQKQIQQGAIVDLFISAAQGPIDALVQDGLVDAATVQTLAVNQVVLIRPTGTDPVVRTWADLTSDKVARVALGDPQHVPAGQYGKAVLEHLNLWSTLEGRLVLGEDVRQVLRYVESGEVQAGIVYRTDGAGSQKVEVVEAAPPGSHAPIVYPVAVLKGAPPPKAAQQFLDYLLSEAGRAILTKHGFTTEE